MELRRPRITSTLLIGSSEDVCPLMKKGNSIGPTGYHDSMTSRKPGPDRSPQHLRPIQDSRIRTSQALIPKASLFRL